jgi:hypothetical protein
MDSPFEKMASLWLGGRAPAPSTTEHHPPASRRTGTSNALPYNDAGSLVIEKVCDTITNLRCVARLSGVGEVPELSETQPVPHPSFGMISSWPTVRSGRVG